MKFPQDIILVYAYDSSDGPEPTLYAFSVRAAAEAFVSLFEDSNYDAGIVGGVGNGELKLGMLLAEDARDRPAGDGGAPVSQPERDEEDLVYESLAALEQVLHDHGLPLDETIEVFAALARSSVRAIADPASQHLAYQVDLRRENARAAAGRLSRCPICSSELT